MRINYDAALSKEVRSAVVPPPLCKTCRWCRPAWGNLILPLFWPFPIFWRGFWESATCRHPTSVEQPRYRDFVTGRREKPRQMHCNSARFRDKDRCGPQARFWEARDYPAWVWMAGSMIAGVVILTAYIAFLRWGFDDLIRLIIRLLGGA